MTAMTQAQQHNLILADLADPVAVCNVELEEENTAEFESEYTAKVLAESLCGENADTPDPFAEFGKAVLRLLTRYDDWCADTFDEIARAAEGVPGVGHDEFACFTWDDPAAAEEAQADG